MFSRYKYVGRDIRLLVICVFINELIHSGFMLVLNILMKKYNYTDSEIAGYTSLRFLGVLLLSLPIGLWIKNRPIKPMLYVSSVALPAGAILLLYSVVHRIIWLSYASFFMWGMGITSLQVCALPFVLRNADPNYESECISLKFASYGFASIISAGLLSILQTLNANYFDEYRILMLLSVFGFMSLIFVYFLREKKISNENNSSFNPYDVNWGIILRALLPTVIISAGAGVAIPFMNLFFYSVFGIDSRQFSNIGIVTNILIMLGFLLVPSIKRKLGYRTAIPLTQMVAVFLLLIISLSEHFKNVSGVMQVAVVAYIFRNPLMNMAGPMTSELVMKYVGEKNRELTSALTSGIWSGSWFFSSLLFGLLRKYDVAYGNIFLITVVLYTIGVWSYYSLIKAYEEGNHKSQINSKQ